MAASICSPIMTLLNVFLTQLVLLLATEHFFAAATAKHGWGHDNNWTDAALAFAERGLLPTKEQKKPEYFFLPWTKLGCKWWAMCGYNHTVPDKHANKFNTAAFCKFDASIAKADLANELLGLLNGVLGALPDTRKTEIWDFPGNSTTPIFSCLQFKQTAECRVAEASCTANLTSSMCRHVKNMSSAGPDAQKNAQNFRAASAACDSKAHEVEYYDWVAKRKPERLLEIDVSAGTVAKSIVDKKVQMPTSTSGGGLSIMDIAAVAGPEGEAHVYTRLANVISGMKHLISRVFW